MKTINTEKENMAIKDNAVYVLFAADKSNGDEYAIDAHAVANSYDLADKIAQKDASDGQIYDGWTITKMHLSTSEEDI